MGLKSEFITIYKSIFTNSCRTDNQPEFMQNLGFVPEAGVPELYSYSSQVEPFLLAQTQQQVPCEVGGVRRGSQAEGKR